MARTRNASNNVTHDDDGELLDKDGKPINPVAHHAGTPEPVGIVPKREEPVSAVVHVADERSLRRDLEAWELGQLLTLIMGPWSVRVPDAEFMKLTPDIRRHFVRMLEPTGG
jgi:hypothetical protein